MPQARKERCLDKERMLCCWHYYWWCIIITTILCVSLKTSAAAVGGIESIDPTIKQEIDDFITNIYLPANNNPGLGLAITSANGSLLYSTGYGLMDVANQLPTTNETLFLIGSISKSFAAIIVCKTLHEKFPQLGSAVVDTPVNVLIPEFNFTLNDRYRSEATSFRDMLSHRVCTKSDGISTLLVPFESSNEIAYRQRYAEKECNFRAKLVYNDGMYALVSAAIEAIAGRTYENLIMDLFSELEMHNTTIVRDSDEDLPPNRAVPYYWKDGERHNYNPKAVSIAIAAGGIVSNAVDMAKYLQFHMNKGKVGDRQVVPEMVMDWLYQTAVHVPLDANSFKPHETDMNLGYGLGLYQATSDGWQRFAHGGTVPPFQSQISAYPAQDIGIFTAVNQMPANATLNRSHLHRAIFDILRGVDPSVEISRRRQNLRKENVRTNNNKTVVKTKTLPVEELEKYVGSYGNGLQGEIEISLRLRNATNTTELYMNFGQWGQAYLLATDSENEFFLHWDSDIVQDKYASDKSDSESFGFFNEYITEFYIVDNGDPTGKFRKGDSLDNLPRIPWSPESCGPKMSDH